jgi:PAS domain S-box-containing protein
MNGMIRLRRYGLAIVSCGLAALAAFRFDAPASCFSLAIMVSNLYGGRGPGLLSIGLSGLIFDYLFLSPRFHLSGESPTHLRLVALLGTGLAIAVLIEAKRRVEVRREQIAAELHKSESYLEEAQRLSHVGSFGWNTATNKIYWSAETSRIAGYQPSVMPSLELLHERIHPDDRAMVKQLLEQASRTGADLDFNHRFQLPDGTTKYVHVVAHSHQDANGAFEYIGTAMDVSLRKHADESLRVSEFNFRLIVESLPGQVCTLTPSGEIEHANQQVLDYFSMTFEELKNWDCTEAVHPDDLTNVMVSGRRSMEAGEPYDLEQRLRRGDGVYRWFHVRSIPVPDKDGNIVRWYNLLTDIDDRKKAEESARARENTFRLILDSIPGIVCTNTPAGELETVNQPLLDYTGMTLEELRAGWPSILHDEDRQQVVEQWSHSGQHGRILDVEFRLLRADGVYRWFHARVVPHHDVDGKIVRSYGLITDIEDRKQAEQALQEAERRYRLVANSIPGLVYTTDGAGEMQFVNQKMQEFLGQPLQVITAWTPYLHADDISKFTDLWRHSVETGNPFEAECRVKRADGVYRWLEVRGSPMRAADGRITSWYNLASDIEGRKRAEQSLRDAENNYRVIVNSIPGMAFTSTVTGEVEFINPQIMAYGGRSLEDLRTDWAASVHPEDRPRKMEMWAYSMKTGVPFDHEARVRRADGVYHWLHSLALPITEADGTVRRWCGLMVDVDDRKRAEEALRETEARLARATQIATVGELAASIAHEINQPLAAVVANSQACLRWLSADPPNTSKARETAEMLVWDGKRSGEVVARLRSLFTRSAQMEQVDVDINDVIREVLRIIWSEAARRSIVVETDLNEAIPLVSGDRVQLQQLLLNLFLNGMEAMAPVLDRPKSLFVRSHLNSDQSILVEVHDSGIGVANPDKIFGAFFTTKENGMGMGLAICRSIVEAHDGTLWAAPGEIQGTTFCFTLPLQTGGPA